MANMPVPSNRMTLDLGAEQPSRSAAIKIAKRQSIEKFFAEVYEVCLKHPDVALSKKQKVLERAGDLGVDSWPVVGITVDALRLFVRQGQLKGIQRGHEGKYGRRDRAKHALEKNLPTDEFVAYFRERDKTVLITVPEQQKHEWSPIIPIDDPTLFRGDGRVQVTTKNLEWAKRIAAEQGLDTQATS